MDAVAPQWVEHLGYMKKILEKGYVALSDLVRYPSAFMLMVRLGADLTPKNNGGESNLFLNDELMLICSIYYNRTVHCMAI